MDADFLQKLFSRETSGEEREMLCQIAYGARFSECAGKVKRDDFANGLGGGRYEILSIGEEGEKRDRLRIRFACRIDTIFEEPWWFLRGSGEYSAVPCRPPWHEYCVCFDKAEIGGETAAAIRRWAENSGIPPGGLMNALKTQDA